MGQITLKNVSKSFGATTIIPNIDLNIENGEFVVFVGPSGCGKSTLLRLIAGLEDTSGGTISINPRNVATVDRGVPITITVAAPCNANALLPLWFYQGRTLTCATTMVKE